MENPNPISIMEALNQVQSWLNAGEFDKVIQGCQEILRVEPENARAVSLLRQAQEKRYAETMKANPSMPSQDPLASLEVEKPQPVPVPEPEVEPAFPEEEAEEAGLEHRKLFFAMLIPAVLVVLLGGGLIWWMATKDREESISDNSSSEDTTVDENAYLKDNDERLDALNRMITVLEAYKEDHGSYPSADEVASVIAESDLFEEIPVDPRQGEIDKAGKVFGYIYAVYDGLEGENTVYVLSALFEDNEGFGTPWAKGAPIKNYPNYRDYKEDNITFIGGNEDDVEVAGKGPADAEDSTEEKSHGPKVNPDN